MSVDLRVGLILVTCLCAVLLTAVAGDHVGVQVLRATPSDSVGRTPLITMLFGEVMDRASVEARFRVEPVVPGQLSWTGPRLIFRPEGPLVPGQAYTAVIGLGAESERGRRLLEDYRHTFVVSGPQVAYLAPEDGPARNLWLLDPNRTEPARQLTKSESGVTSFDVSPDGTRFAYSEAQGGPRSELRLLDLDTGLAVPLGSCAQWVCTGPSWSPDGTRLAYERFGYSPIQPGTAASSARVWLIDLASTPPAERQLQSDTQTPPSLKPRWSPDGKRLAVSQLPAQRGENPQVHVYDLSDGSSVSFSTSFSSMATFSPDGSQLLYPALVAREGSVRTLLHVADVASGQVTQLQGLDDQAQEALAGWTPDGTGIVVAIRSDGNTKTPGRQLFRMNRNDGRMTPLLVDDGYDHSAFVWEPGGERLLVQRSRVWSGAAGAPTVDRRPELVLLHPADTQPRLLAANAFAPRWVP